MIRAGTVEGIQQYAMAIRPQSSSTLQHTFRSCNSLAVSDAQYGVHQIQQGTISLSSVRIILLHFDRRIKPRRHICCLKV